MDVTVNEIDFRGKHRRMKQARYRREGRFQPRAGICAGWSSLRSTTVRAESSTPRASSVKNGFSMSRVTSAMTSDSCFRSVRAVRWGELQLAGCFALGERIRIGDATPLKTRDTVAGDTSGSFATS